MVIELPGATTRIWSDSGASQDEKSRSLLSAVAPGSRVKREVPVPAAVDGRPTWVPLRNRVTVGYPFSTHRAVPVLTNCSAANS